MAELPGRDDRGKNQRAAVHLPEGHLKGIRHCAVAVGRRADGRARGIPRPAVQRRQNLSNLDRRGAAAAAGKHGMHPFPAQLRDQHGKLCQVVLAGQLELRDRMMTRRYKAFRSRIVAPVVLELFTAEETNAMIGFRHEYWQVANRFSRRGFKPEFLESK
jgi:hypothetical protein